MDCDLDLQAAIESFVASLPQDMAEIESDKKVAAAMSRDDGESRAELAKWLHTYKVLMGFPTDLRDKICAAIVMFANEPDRPKRLNGADEILGQFDELERRIQSVLAAEGMPARRVTSLCSKALWCCYPEDVPIYDANALVALNVLARLSGIAPESQKNGYERFLSQWLKTYSKLRQYFEGKDLHALCGYSVRAFDRFLWHLADTSE